MAAIARLSFMVWQLCSWLCSITNKPSRQGGLMSHEAHPKSAHLLSHLLPTVPNHPRTPCDCGPLVSVFIFFVAIELLLNFTW